MIALDTTILVYAHREELAKHGVAKRRLVELAEPASAFSLSKIEISIASSGSRPSVFDPESETTPWEAITVGGSAMLKATDKDS